MRETVRKAVSEARGVPLRYYPELIALGAFVLLLRTLQEIYGRL